MSESPEQKPWYKRWWATIVLVVVGVLGGIAAVVGKVFLSKKKVIDAQKDDQKVLKDRLDDKAEVGKAKLEAVDAKADAAKTKADAEHKEKLDAIDDKAKADAAKNGADPDAAARSLGSALERAAHKLNNPGSGVQ